MLRWLKDVADQKKVLFDEKLWTIEVCDCPQQGTWKDYTSCGVCVIINAILLTSNLPLTYGGKEVMYFRRRIGAEILKG